MMPDGRLECPSIEPGGAHYLCVGVDPLVDEEEEKLCNGIFSCVENSGSVQFLSSHMTLFRKVKVCNRGGLLNSIEFYINTKVF